MSTQFSFFATCPKGLAQLLQGELEELGLTTGRQTISGIYFSGDLKAAYRACLWSRLANRVLLVLSVDEVESADDLYQAASGVRWDDHLSKDGRFVVDFSGSTRAINNTQFGAQKVKDAVVDRFVDRFGSRPSVDKEQPDIRINARLSKGELTLALDLSGSSLHQRGYRRKGGMAPLKENLAAALLYRAKWPQMAEQGHSLIDPLCGSGTLLIEGAMMAADIAPGLLRDKWGFSRWLEHVPLYWRELADEAQDRANKGLDMQPLWIQGWDTDEVAIRAAKSNISNANLANWINVERRPLDEFSLPEEFEHGLLITNPPYGERIGDEPNLMYLYRTLGDQLKFHCQGWQAAVFTGNVELARRMRLAPHKQYQLMNGALPCKLLLFDVDSRARSTDDKPVTSSQESKNNLEQAPVVNREQAEMFANRLKKNLKQISKWAKKENVSCYRIYDADMPEFAIAVDKYNDWIHVQEYVAPKTIDPEKASQRLLDALAVIPGVTGVAVDKVVLKRRKKQSGAGQYQKLSHAGDAMQVEEGGCQLLVNLTDYLDTGLFLDHRPMRFRIQQEAKGKRFLNLFCYTATASVHAAHGGASETVSVDLSNTYLRWAEKNMQLNGFKRGHQFIQADCVQWLSDLSNDIVKNENHQEKFDLIFMDPPTFSNSKRTENVLDIQRDHAELVTHAMQCLAENGVLYFSNNFRKFKLEPVLKEQFMVEDITGQSIPKDFARNTKIHNCWRIAHKI